MHSTINAVCGQQKGQNTAKSHVTEIKKKKKFVCLFFWNFTDSVSSRQFREFRDFSAIAENHWPYVMRNSGAIESCHTEK